jgi:predicted flap endonuclease-1-like 5' DNA nuclease
MSTWTIVLAMLASMVAGGLIAILIDTIYVRRWHEEMEGDRAQLEEELRQQKIKLGRAEAKYDDMSRQIQAYQRELEEEQKEVERLETAVAEMDTLKAELIQFDDEMDSLRDEKVELARQLTVAQVEMKNLEEDLTEDGQKLELLDGLEVENQKLTAKLEAVEKERDERKAEAEELLHQLAEAEKLRANLKDKEEPLETSIEQLDNMQTAQGRAGSQIKHTGKSQLQIIKGIGPATERKLKVAGIVTIVELAQESPERIREILNLKPTSRTDPETWIEEAQKLAPTFADD